jgi:hypothetical protein
LQFYQKTLVLKTAADAGVDASAAVFVERYRKERVRK